MTVETQQIVETPSADLPTAEDKNDEAMGAVFDKLQQDNFPAETKEPAARANDGKFAAKAVDKTTSLEGEAGAETTDAGSTVAQGSSAPAHLPQAIKADWAKIPESSRAAIVAHQVAMDQKFSEVGRQLSQVKPIHDRLTQAVTQFPEFAGRSPEQLAQGAVELAAVQSKLERGGQGAIETLLEVAQHYNMLPALAQRLGGSGGQQQQSGADYSALQSELQSLRQQVAQAQITPERINSQVSQALEHRNILTEVSAFEADKATAPFFADVANDIPYFVERVMKASPAASPKEVLGQAYDMAVNADPDVRKKVRALEAQKATTAAVGTKRTDAARIAASININPATRGRTREMTEDELLGSVFDSLAS